MRGLELSPVLIALVSFAAVACGGNDNTPPPSDAGGHDTGPLDGGPGLDAGPADDAGTLLDAGNPDSPAADGGSAVCDAHAAGALVLERDVPTWSDRPYDLRLPSAYDCHVPVPVLLVFHGGGSNKNDMQLLSCPGTNPRVRPTDSEAPGCLNAIAETERIAVVYANGTRNPTAMGEVRTFNAGGGRDGYECVSGYACDNTSDDVAYVDDLLDDLETVVLVDRGRVFAAGISNGAAMSHRLACELPGRITAIAPISGGNQLAAVDTCVPPRAIPVLEIHGDADRAWPYLGGPGTGLVCTLTMCEDMVGIPDRSDLVRGPSTIGGWLARNGCDVTPVTSTLPDVDPGDGSTVTVDTWGACAEGVNVVLYSVAGGGHTWPGGFQYLAVATIGRTNRDINASQVMIDFFRAQTGDW